MKKDEILTIEEIEKMKSNFLTADEAARALNLARITFYRQIWAGKIKFPINRIGKKYAVPKEPFLEYLRAERNVSNGRFGK